MLLSFLLLMAVFRSLLIPLTAAVMNMLSAGAAFGVVTAVFQFGWGDALLGIDKAGPIEAFLPVLMFPILFGLSMDYEVFLMSRVYEEWHRRGDNRAAVTHGLAATGRTITAAAAIMILVFGAFVLGGERIIELFGVGLAGAVLLDALIVRSVLVPAVMMLFGDRNWSLPAGIDRILPHLSVEGQSARAAAVDGPGLGDGRAVGNDPRTRAGPHRLTANAINGTGVPDCLVRLYHYVARDLSRVCPPPGRRSPRSAARSRADDRRRGRRGRGHASPRGGGGGASARLDDVLV